MKNQELYEAILSYDANKAVKIVNEELDKGVDPLSLINESLISAMDEVGKRFSEGTLYIPEMFLAAKAFQTSLDEIKPKLLVERESQGKVVIGTVKGDMHDIGKNMVAMMLESSGFDVVDLGTDVHADRFLSAAMEQKADVVAMSALLTTTLREMQAVVDTFRENGMKDQVQFIIGGAPVTEAFAKKIGADGYSKDAPGAVQLVRNLINK